jgi:hypothetical protein
MTSLEIIPVASGTVIRTNDNAEAMTVLPGAPVWKDGRRLFACPEGYSRIVAAIRAATTPDGE